MGKFALPCHVSKDIILSNLLNQDVSSLILNHVKKQETIDEIKFRTDITDTFKDTYGPDWTHIMWDIGYNVYNEYNGYNAYIGYIDYKFILLYNKRKRLMLTDFNSNQYQLMLTDLNSNQYHQMINLNSNLNIKKKKKNKAKQEKPIRKERTKQMRYENRAMMKRMRKGSFKH